MSGIKPLKSSVIEDIADAVRDAQIKHGTLSQDPVRACAIMIREGGEAMNEALLMTVPDRVFGYQADRRNWDRRKRQLLYAELAQVAATAAIIMGNIKEQIDAEA